MNNIMKMIGPHSKFELEWFSQNVSSHSSNSCCVRGTHFGPIIAITPSSWRPCWRQEKPKGGGAESEIRDPQTDIPRSARISPETLRANSSSRTFQEFSAYLYNNIIVLIVFEFEECEWSVNATTKRHNTSPNTV